MIRSQQRVT